MLKFSFIDPKSRKYDHNELKTMLETSSSTLFGRITGVSGILGEWHTNSTEEYFVIVEAY